MGGELFRVSGQLLEAKQTKLFQNGGGGGRGLVVYNSTEKLCSSASEIGCTPKLEQTKKIFFQYNYYMYTYIHTQKKLQQHGLRQILRILNNVFWSTDYVLVAVEQC